MASKRTASILVIVGGVFYILGGVLLAGVVDLLDSSSGLGGLGSSENACSFFGAAAFCGSSNSTSDLFGGGLGSGLDMGAIADILLVVGVITGGLIIFGGWLMNSENSGRRKIGAIIAIIMVLIGGLTTFGGLVIGFILVCVGVYLGLTLKSRGMVIPLGPMASVTLGPQQLPSGPSSNIPAGTGPLNYCTKCGSQIRPGSVFCGACGARLGE